MVAYLVVHLVALMDGLMVDKTAWRRAAMMAARLVRCLVAVKDEMKAASMVDKKALKMVVVRVALTDLNLVAQMDETMVEYLVALLDDYLAVDLEMRMAVLKAVEMVAKMAVRRDEMMVEYSGYTMAESSADVKECSKAESLVLLKVESTDYH